MPDIIRDPSAFIAPLLCAVFIVALFVWGFALVRRNDPDNKR